MELIIHILGFDLFKKVRVYKDPDSMNATIQCQPAFFERVIEKLRQKENRKHINLRRVGYYGIEDLKKVQEEVKRKIKDGDCNLITIEFQVRQRKK